MEIGGSFMTIDYGEFEQYRKKPPTDYDEFEQYRVQPQAQERAQTQSQQSANLMQHLPPWALGLLQGGEDLVKGFSAGSSEMEVPVPDMFKPERLRKEGLNIGEYPQENETPSFDFKQYTDGDSDTAFNVGRYGPLALSLGLTGGKAVAGAARGITSKAIGNKIVDDANRLANVFKSKYDNFFSTLPKKVDVPKRNIAVEFNQDIPLKVEEARNSSLAAKLLGSENIDKYKNVADEDLIAPLEKLITNPSIENKHRAKTAANELFRELDRKKATPGGLDTSERAARKAALEMNSRLTKSILEDLDKLGPEFKEIYKGLTKEYGEYMAPYLGNRDIRRARMNPRNEYYINPSRLPAKLSKERGDPFMSMLGSEYPELYYNRLLTGPVGKVAGLGALLKFGPDIIGER